MTAQISTFQTRKNLLEKHNLAATSADLKAVLTNEKSPFHWCESVNAKIDEWGIDPTPVFAVDRNPKAIKRFIQFVHAIDAKQYKQVDLTTCTILYALHLAGDNPLTVDALHYIGAGLKSGKISPETRGVSRQTVQKLFGRVGLSTIPTQTSRSVGANGFLQLVGATVGEPRKPNQSVRLVNTHPMVTAFFDLMNKASQAQIDEMIGDK